MKEITQAEFEQYILDVINGKKTRIQMAQELKADSRTLKKRIQLLSIENPKLYLKYIQKYPHKPKEITTLPIKSIIYEFLTTGINIKELAEKYGVGGRTIRRKIEALGKSKKREDIHLYNLYKAFAYNKAHGKKNSPELLYEISKLEIESEDTKQDDAEKRRQYLLELEKQYQELCLTMKKGEAAKQMGFTSNKLYKLQQELYCIEIERNTIDKNSRFREKMAVKPDELSKGKSELTQVQETELEKE